MKAEQKEEVSNITVELKANSWYLKIELVSLQNLFEQLLRSYEIACKGLQLWNRITFLIK